MALTLWEDFCSLFKSSICFSQTAVHKSGAHSLYVPHMLPASGQWLFILHSAVCLPGGGEADHWSVHLSLSCPLYLTVEINGKHPKRTRTRRCITACQAVPSSRSASLHFDWTTAKFQAFIRQITAWLKTVELMLLWASRNVETSIISSVGWFCTHPFSGTAIPKYIIEI